MTDDVPLRLRTITEIVRASLKNSYNLLLITLIIITGGFFYFQKNGLPRMPWAQAKMKDTVLGRIVGQQYCLVISKQQQDIQQTNIESPIEAIECLIPEEKDTEQQNDFERELYSIVGDAPIREMVPAIAKLDRKTAAFVVGIAKKESSWGEYVPTQNGSDCFNYWGYKGVGSKGTGMGYGCFATPEEGVKTIASRIEELSRKGNRLTPASMVVWKCGSSCAGHDPQGVKSWIGTVDTYFKQIARVS